MLRRLFMLLALWGLFAVVPAQAAVVITFWSHDQDQDFPHTFFALEGTPDAGGPPIDANYGFTAKLISPAILLGNVGGKVEDAKPAYMLRSDPQFSLVLSDTQLAQIQALISEWNDDSRYTLNKRNCVHFVAEAARRAGLVVPDLPKLMKKPRSFLQAVSAANADRITPIALSGKAYLEARGAPVVPLSTVQTPPTVVGAAPTPPKHR